jgi:hypothetical protein
MILTPRYAHYYDNVILVYTLVCCYTYSMGALLSIYLLSFRISTSTVRSCAAAHPQRPEVARRAVSSALACDTRSRATRSLARAPIAERAPNTSCHIVPCSTSTHNSNDGRCAALHSTAQAVNTPSALPRVAVPQPNR